MNKEIELLDVIDITVPFKDDLYDKKICPFFKIENNFEKECRLRALKHITYGNMFVYSNLCIFNGHFISYITQSSERIDSYSITFLN